MLSVVVIRVVVPSSGLKVFAFLLKQFPHAFRNVRYCSILSLTLSTIFKMGVGRTLVSSSQLSYN